MNSILTKKDMEKNRMSTNDNTKAKNTPDVKNRAGMNGKKGKFETEELEKTGTSAMPGAEEVGNVGDAASGAGLGGNKGTGTRSKKDFT